MLTNMLNLSNRSCTDQTSHAYINTSVHAISKLSLHLLSDVKWNVNESRHLLYQNSGMLNTRKMNISFILLPSIWRNIIGELCKQDPINISGLILNCAPLHCSFAEYTGQRLLELQNIIKLRQSFRLAALQDIWTRFIYWNTILENLNGKSEAWLKTKNLSKSESTSAWSWLCPQHSNHVRHFQHVLWYM